MLRNSAMVLGSGTLPIGGGLVTVVTRACRVVRPLLSDEGTRSSVVLFSEPSVPVP